jgi:adenosylmethionine-8-amino-7-oxononanoate aminotransferase
MLAALELVRDKERKEKFDPALKIGERLFARAFANGLIIRAFAGGVLGWTLAG